MEETRFFVDLGLLLLGALAGGLLAHALRQPLIVGYILGGILVGPFTPGPTISDLHSFRLFAEIGVILLMFSVGVEFSIRELLQAGKVALYGAPLGIALIVLLTIPAGQLLGWPLAQTLVVGAAISVASTMVILKFLLERRELTSRHGRIIVGITLMEDLAVVAMTILLPALGPGAEQRFAVFARSLGIALLIMLPLLWLANRVMPRLLLRVAKTGSMELFFLVAVAAAIGTAALTARLGLSVALGAFLAGLVISEAEIAHEALARLLPMRDIFVAAFFVSIGTLVSPTALLAEIPTVLVLVLLVTVGKFMVWTAVIRLAGDGRRTAMLAALGLTQIGEFSYILVGVGLVEGLITPGVYYAVLATSVLTILVNAFLFRGTPRWLRRLLAGPEPAVLPDAGEPASDARVVLCGFGRVGREVADALEVFGISYIVIELSPAATEAARMRGARALFGDAGNELILERAGTAAASLVVVAVPDFTAAHRCVSTVRRMREDVPIIARVHQERHRGELIAAGATEVIQPEVEAALTIARHSLDRLGIEHQRSRAFLEEARRHWPAAEPSTESVGGAEGGGGRQPPGSV